MEILQEIQRSKSLLLATVRCAVRVYVRGFDVDCTPLRRLWGGLGTWGRQDCNRELRRIPLPRSSVNTLRSVHLRCRFMRDSSSSVNVAPRRNESTEWVTNERVQS